MISDRDVHYMRRALALARRGSGYVNPNPLVGALVVNGTVTLGYGWHERYGGPHAEINALEMAGEGARGSTLYVTLEPCNHIGKTAPCTEKILSAKISRVVVAMRDPNPDVCGGGIERLRGAGVVVEVGVLNKECEELNSMWIASVSGRGPLVVLKLALSLDGKLAYSCAESRWISSLASRRRVHRLRRHFDAVMIGVGTVLADNPSLGNRSGRGSQPLRIVADSTLRTPVTSALLANSAKGGPGAYGDVLIASTSAADRDKRATLERCGARVEFFDGADGRVDLESLFTHLASLGVQGVLCEGGAEIAESLLTQGLCHRLLIYRAPVIIGSSGRPFCGAEVAAAGSDVRFALLDSRCIGGDLMSLYEVCVKGA